ncbi:hypothetical protein [Xanthomonas bonasiae]|uniref:hypothetical protein n=1 Tax=Xanthomonas bonasiae TaxID=2810351 RepID=UPI001786E91C|nr:hypothetical protein [Xanthomonas surreyensis]MBD7923240.1 hypothetical protein [Xanthomonas surreyensis]
MVVAATPAGTWRSVAVNPRSEALVPLPAQILSPAILDTLAKPLEVKAMGPASVIAGSRHTVVLHHLAMRLAHPYSGF